MDSDLMNKEQPRSSMTRSAGIKCYECGKMGHIVAYCQMNVGLMACYHFNQEGHFARECLEKVPKGDGCVKVLTLKGQNGGNRLNWDEQRCVGCKLKGHVTAKCPSMMDLFCKNCALSIHIALSCPWLGDSIVKYDTRRTCMECGRVGAVHWPDL